MAFGSSHSPHGVPVYVGQLRAAAEPRPLLAHHTAVENMQSGAVLDAEHEHTANGTPIVSYARTGQDNQSWDLEFYDDSTVRFRGVGSDRCIASPQQGPESLDQLRLADCVDSSNQHWVMESLGNDQWQFHLQLRSDLCMNVRGGQTNPTQAKDVILYACQNTPNERFTLTTAGSSTDQDPDGWVRQPRVTYGAGPYSLENANGAYMDVYHERTANDSDVIAWPRTGDANQGWLPRWRDGHTAAFEGVGSHRCLDIYNSTDQVGPDRHLVVWDCTGQASQGWIGVLLNNGQIQWHNEHCNDLCLDVADRAHDPQTHNNPGALITQNCTIGWGTQQWSFVSFDVTGIYLDRRNLGSAVADMAAVARATAQGAVGTDVRAIAPMDVDTNIGGLLAWNILPLVLTLIDSDSRFVDPTKPGDAPRPTERQDTGWKPALTTRVWTVTFRTQGLSYASCTLRLKLVPRSTQPDGSTTDLVSIAAAIISSKYRAGIRHRRPIRIAGNPPALICRYSVISDTQSSRAASRTV